MVNKRFKEERSGILILLPWDRWFYFWLFWFPSVGVSETICEFVTIILAGGVLRQTAQYYFNTPVPVMIIP